MTRVGIRRVAGLLALLGQLVLPLPLFAMTVTADGGDAICSAHSAAGFDRSAPTPSGALHNSGHCALCAAGVGCTAPPPTALSPIAYAPPRALAPSFARVETLVRHALADARAPPPRLQAA
ncbi:MAG TPA: DUF2946 family protein [Casimicrobiaceae bacterium]